MIYTNEINGVMPMKDDKTWDIIYEDHSATAYGWVDIKPLGCNIYNPETCIKPTDVLRGERDNHYRREFHGAKLVKVKKTVILEILE